MCKLTYGTYYVVMWYTILTHVCSAFVVAPVAMESFGAASNAMSVLFFLMLFTLGIDSIFAYVETIVAGIDGLAVSRKLSSFFVVSCIS